MATRATCIEKRIDNTGRIWMKGHIEMRVVKTPMRAPDRLSKAMARLAAWLDNHA